jgi:hypothetical protein
LRFRSASSSFFNHRAVGGKPPFHFWVSFQSESYVYKLKKTIGSFFYHFWTAVMPGFSCKTTETDLRRITDPKGKEKIAVTAKAIQVFPFMGCVPMGIQAFTAMN